MGAEMTGQQGQGKPRGRGSVFADNTPSGDDFTTDFKTPNPLEEPQKKPFKEPDPNEDKALSRRNEMIVNPKDFADIHAAIYQTEFDNDEKVEKQRGRMNVRFGNDIPHDAEKGIEVAQSIFGSDKHMNPYALGQALRKVIAIESGGTTRVQGGGGPARGYAQVEPSTAKDLATNSRPLFGKKFEAQFPGMLDKMKNGSIKEVSKMLEDNENLAMSMAAAKLMTDNRARKSIVKLFGDGVRTGD
jgi:hypothetical protein